jgi:hypothetical protein
MLHPGAVITHLLEEYMPPGSVHVAQESPFLAGGVAVWLAGEVGQEKMEKGWLGGRYLSALWDVEEILERKEEIVSKDLLRMRLDMK